MSFYFFQIDDGSIVIRNMIKKHVMVIEKSIGDDAKKSNFISTERTGYKKGSVTEYTKLFEGVMTSEAKKDINILTNIKSIRAVKNLSTVNAVTTRMLLIITVPDAGLPKNTVRRPFLS